MHDIMNVRKYKELLSSIWDLIQQTIEYVFYSLSSKFYGKLSYGLHAETVYSKYAGK